MHIFQIQWCLKLRFASFTNLFFPKKLPIAYFWFFCDFTVKVRHQIFVKISGVRLTASPISHAHEPHICIPHRVISWIFQKKAFAEIFAQLFEDTSELPLSTVHIKRGIYFYFEVCFHDFLPKWSGVIFARHS